MVPKTCTFAKRETMSGAGGVDCILKSMNAGHTAHEELICIDGSVSRGNSFRVVDDDGLQILSRGLKLQAELFLYGGEQRGFAGGVLLRRPGQLEGVFA